MTSLIVRNKVPVRNLRNWSSFDEFENLVNRIFNNIYSSGDQETGFPVELVEKDNTFIMKAMLPGLKKEDINIEVSEDRVTISGECKFERDESKDLVYRSEFFEGKFERTITMPQKIDHRKVKADYNDGMLTLNMPKSEKELDKVVKISL